MRFGCWRTHSHKQRHLSIEQLERRDLFAGLLNQSDLQYLGAFALPSGTFGASTFECGGTALAFNAANNSLFLVGHDWDQAIAEVSIPPIHTGSLNGLSSATVVQPFVDVLARVPDYALEGTVKVGGLLVENNQLIGTAYEYYDADANAIDSHFKLSSLNLASASVTGLFQVGDLGGGYVGGYMATVPPEWQSRLGVSYLTGQAGLSIISRTSAGPAAFGFDPAQLGSNAAPITPLVYYPLAHPLAQVDAQNSLFNTTTQITGMVFPDGTDSVIFFGRHGTGPWWYGDNDPARDPAVSYKGPHAYPYIYQAWAYNALDLLAVKNGAKHPWEVQPYGVWNLNLPYVSVEDAHWSGGVAYDRATGRIFVSELHQDEAKPVIHVFQVSTPDADPTQGVYLYDNPPPLPASDPATTVNVSNISQLRAALGNLRSGQTIRLAAGTYDLSGIIDALYVPQGITNWSIRGATGNRNDVVIKGAGMNGSVRFGFWTGNSPNGTIADLTIDGTEDNAIIVNPGSNGMLFHNLRIVDSGSQFIKSNPDATGNGNDRGIVEYCVFEYRTTDTDNYTNGVDIHGGDGWIVRYNLFRNFLSPTGQGLAGSAVLAWNGSSNTTVEGNTFMNVARGVSLGLVDKAGGFDHQGGLIVNNVFYRDPSLPQSVDVPILVADSPNTKILHNTVLNRGSYPNAIEYRYASSTGLQIRNNLTDAAIRARDGAVGSIAGNTTNASLTWFVDPTAGDLHLVSTATVINHAAVLAEVPRDVDGQLRGTSPDVGADEYSVVLPQLGTPGDDTRFLVVSGDGASLEIYDGDPTTGSVKIASWPMSNTQPFEIDTLEGDDIIIIELPAGTNGPLGGINVETGSGSNRIEVRGGRMRLDAIATGGLLNTEVHHGAEVITSRLNQAGLTIADAGSRVTLTPAGQVSLLTTLQLGTGATLDIADNALVLNYTGASPIAEVRVKLLNGRGGSGLGGAWNGTGIVSSTAAQRNLANPAISSVAYAENALLPLGAYASFRGQAVDDTTVLIAYTRTADANLDDVVNDDDVTVVGTFYAPGVSKPEWAKGDFDYNGFVNDDDVTLLGAFFNSPAMPAPPPAQSVDAIAWSAKPVALVVQPDPLWTKSLAPPDKLTVSRPRLSALAFTAQARERAPSESINSSTRCFTAWDDELQHRGPQDRKGNATLIDLLAESIAAQRSVHHVSLAHPRIPMLRMAAIADYFLTGQKERMVPRTTDN